MWADRLHTIALGALGQAGSRKLERRSTVARTQAAIAIGHERLFELQPLLAFAGAAHARHGKLAFAEIEHELCALRHIYKTFDQRTRTERLRRMTG